MDLDSQLDFIKEEVPDQTESEFDQSWDECDPQREPQPIPLPELSLDLRYLLKDVMMETMEEKLQVIIQKAVDVAVQKAMISLEKSMENTISRLLKPSSDNQRHHSTSPSQLIDPSDSSSSEELTIAKPVNRTTPTIATKQKNIEDDEANDRLIVLPLTGQAMESPPTKRMLQHFRTNVRKVHKFQFRKVFDTSVLRAYNWTGRCGKKVIISCPYFQVIKEEWFNNDTSQFRKMMKQELKKAAAREWAYLNHGSGKRKHQPRK